MKIKIIIASFRGLALGSLFWLALFSTATTAPAAPRTLNLFIWSEYIDPAIVKAFAREFDCRVNIDLYEDAESMLAKVQSTGAGSYDVVVPSDNLVPALIKQKLLAPLRRENLPNLKNLDAPFVNPAYDPGNQFTVAYQWGTVGILARPAPGQPAPDSWGVFFDPKQQAGPFLLIDSVRDAVGAALKYQGNSVNTTDPKQLKAARDLLIEAKRRSVGFDGSVGAKNKILGKTAQVGIVYSGEGVRAIAENTNLVYVVPKEGSIIWVDNLAVLAKAPHRDLAEQFINFILDPKIGAQLSGFTQFSTPNRAAKEFLKPADLQNPASYPPAETTAKLEFLQDLGAKLRIYDEVWTQVKSK
jgi:spermidine/putrescine transport system substrate-binding protein